MNTFSERPGAEQRKNSTRRVDFSKHPIHALASVDDAVVSRRYFVNTLSCEYLSLVQYHRVTPELRRKLPEGTARSRNLFGFRRAAAAISPSPLSARAEAGSALRLSSANKASYRLDSRSHGLPATGHDWLISPPLLLPWLEICAHPQIAPEFIFTELPVCILRVK